MKRTLVLVPGLACDARLWQPQCDAFAASFDVIIADHTSDDTMAGIASRILANAKGRFAIAGMSMGGYAALEVARQAPERVSHLGLFCTHARGQTEEGKSARLSAITLAEKGRYAEWLDGFVPKFAAPNNDPAFAAFARRMLEAAGPEIFIRQQKAIMTSADMRSCLPLLHMPALVLGGARDALIPVEMLSEMAAALPHADLHVLAECGHMAQLERPGLVTALMADWLAR